MDKEPYNILLKKVANVIAQHLNDTTYNENKPLYEMSADRNDFIQDFKSNWTREVIRNYALIYYASTHNSHDNLINHWRGELITHIMEIQYVKTKPKPNNRRMVYNAIKYVWINYLELDTQPDAVVNKFIAKFNDENIKCTEEEYLDIANSFISNMDNIMKEVAYGTRESTYKFVNSI